MLREPEIRNRLACYFAGTYGCVAISSGMPTVNKSVVHTNISVRVWSGSVLSDTLTVAFLPAVFVHTKQLNLNDATMATDISVSGRPDLLKQLRVSWSVTVAWSLGVSWPLIGSGNLPQCLPVHHDLLPCPPTTLTFILI
jgi:hypothetical protein